MIAHGVGAILAFGIGTIYAWMQVYYSFYLLKHFGSRAVCFVRLTLAVLTTTFLITSILYNITMGWDHRDIYITYISMGGTY